MRPSQLALSVTLASGGLPQFTDEAVAPVPVAQYLRYATYLAIGTRTYTCNPSTRNFTLVTFDYDIYDVDLPRNETTQPQGKHVLLLGKDAEGGNSVFYTRVGIFTYWVGKTTFFAPNPPESSSPLNLPLEQSLRTEASEPKLLGTNSEKYDMGIATYATRFGAIGGNIPPGTECETTVVVPCRTYYSMWRKIA